MTRRLPVVAAGLVVVGLLVWGPHGDGTAGARARAVHATRTTLPNPACAVPVPFHCDPAPR